MNHINNEYFILYCGSDNAPSPYTACSKEHYLIFQYPTSLREPIYAESPADVEENIPLIDAMELDGMPMVTNAIKRELDYLDIYQQQLLPVCYCHADESEHSYWAVMLDNSLAVYGFDKGQYTHREADDSVSAINIRLDADKLLVIPFTKRRMFEVKGMSSTYIVHKSVTERLTALNAKELHLVPQPEWDMGFGFTI